MGYVREPPDMLMKAIIYQFTRTPPAIIRSESCNQLRFPTAGAPLWSRTSHSGELAVGSDLAGRGVE